MKFEHAMMSPTKANTKRTTATALALCCTFLTPSFAVAEQVTLQSADGATSVTGDLVDFTGDVYVVKTSTGEMEISAAEVTCEGAGCPSEDADPEPVEADYHIAGSDTVGLSLMPLLLESYASSLNAVPETIDTGVEHQFFTNIIGDDGFGDPVGSFLVTATGSSDGFRGLIAETAELGMSSRPIRPQEARTLADAGAGDMSLPAQEHIIAIDSLIVVVNPDNPVDTLSMDQLRGIFSGTIQNWSEVGGPDEPIQVMSRNESSGTRAVFSSRIFGENVPELPASTQIVAGNGEMAEGVASTLGGIGYVGYAYRDLAKPLNLISDCGLETEPTAFATRTEDYPLQRFLYLYSRQDMLTETISDFIDFTVSNEADLVVAKSGFISLAVEQADQNLEGVRGRQLLATDVSDAESAVMREMLAEMLAYDRLSTTFRFRTGSSSLTPRGRDNLKRLEEYLAAQPEGTEILFVGFTDDVGSFNSNRSLSIGRAEQVANEFRQYVGDRLPNVQIGVQGFGEVAPSTCNTNELGRSINRRVEVWIKTTG